MTNYTQGYIVYPDNNGVLHNTLTITQTQPHWMEAVESFVQHFATTKYPNIHSIYLRGSVASGRAIDLFSDIDFYILTHETVTKYDVLTINKFTTKLNKQYQFITKFDIGYYTTEQILKNKEGALLKITALCIYGTDISSAIPAPHIEEHMTLSISQIEEDIQTIKSDVANGVYDDKEKLRSLCIWISKKIIRSGFEIVTKKAQCFTRDLLVCKDIFTQYYPEKQPEMETVINLFLYQTNNVADVVSLLENLGEFLVQEYKATQDFS